MTTKQEKVAQWGDTRGLPFTQLKRPEEKRFTIIVQEIAGSDHLGACEMGDEECGQQMRRFCKVCNRRFCEAHGAIYTHHEIAPQRDDICGDCEDLTPAMRLKVRAIMLEMNR